MREDKYLNEIRVTQFALWDQRHLGSPQNWAEPVIN